MNAYNAVGYMPMPTGFPFRELFFKGRPKHKKYDDFWRKHPPMEPARRAKIFAPFDALVGFDEAVASKEVLYEPKRCLSENEKEHLNKKLQVLAFLTRSGKDARKNRPTAAVTYFVPCSDKNSFAYGLEGTYRTLTGFVEKVGRYTMTVDGQDIPLEDVSDIITPG